MTNKTVVITGSTRGIGLGLANEFLARDCGVIVSGRGQAAVDKAVSQLASKHSPDRVSGQPCDVTHYEQVQALWDVAQARFGRVDIWINNAGVGNPDARLWEQTPDTIHAVVNVNLVGAMYGAKVAIQGMLNQGGGHLYNMEGFGSDGGMRVGLGVYGSTKYAIRYLSHALAKETDGTSVKVSVLSPGIVATDLLADGYVNDPKGFESAKRIFNILGDRVETVTPWLVEQVLANDKSGARIEWLTRPKLIARFMAAPFRKRDIFS